jgi:hypothetical protein
MSQMAPRYTWGDLASHLAPEVLQAPKTGGDPNGEWPIVHERVAGYIRRNLLGTPWADHVALIAAVLTARRRDVQTVALVVQTLHGRFRALFPALELKTIFDWKPGLHLPAYLKGAIVQGDSQYTRQSFLNKCLSATRQVQNWLDALPLPEQEIYRRFVLPVVNPLAIEGLDKKKEVTRQQQEARKLETAAIVPSFAQLRAEAHFRYNRLARLHQVYQQVLKQVRPDRSNLPLDFSYEEGDPPQERLHFRLWDRRSFVREHREQYSAGARSRSKHKHGAFSDEHNSFLLEFVKAERLDSHAPPESFWFIELLQKRLIGNLTADFAGNEAAVAERQAWLRAWGYGEDDPDAYTMPFHTKVPGLLTWGEKEGGDGQFLADAHTKTDGVFLPVESLYAAATFGLLSIDLLTSTGMRMNELHQVSLSPDCLIQLIDDAPPGAKDPLPRIRYLLRLLPKGERTDTLHNYGIGKETVRFIEKAARMLCDHYGLQAGDALPHVAYHPHNGRSHRFGKAAYLFQYAHQHLEDQAITACMRFLMHGMTFQTSTGKPVILKAHLLRHSFATYAVQVAGLPVDLVAEWLKQKNLDTTRYYSRTTPEMAASEHDAFVERLATKINIREAILRSPEELRRQAEDARKRIGTLVSVVGGECTLDAYCPDQLGNCIHCPAKVPDPGKRHQVEEKMHWAEEQLAYYEQEGLVLEAERLKQFLRKCALELREMEMISNYRKDERIAPTIQIQQRPKRSS